VKVGGSSWETTDTKQKRKTKDKKQKTKDKNIGGTKGRPPPPRGYPTQEVSPLEEQP